MNKTKLKVFISAPSDVGQERVIMKRVLNRLQDEFDAYIELEDTDKSFSADIALYILWCKLGDKIGFKEAAEAYVEKGFPDLIVYKKTAEASMEETSKELIEFLDEWFGNPSSGFKAAFHTFDDLNEFEVRLEAHLRKLILPKITHYNKEESHPITWNKGSPFRGLEYFNEEYSKVFYGRTRDIGEIKEKFLYQDAIGNPFLLVLGMSGCGKSSLARAGVLPLITELGVIEGVDLWEKAIFTPSESPKDLIHGLLKSLGQEYLSLEEDFKRDLELGISRMKHMVKIKSYKEKTNKPYTWLPNIKIFLLIDQLEDLFINSQILEEDRNIFFRLLYKLVHSGFIWILANMRSDFYNRILEYEELVEIKEGKGQYDLTPPGFPEMSQIIIKPAKAAGLTFEIDTDKGVSLKDVILEEAFSSTNNLPLLQFTLNELYKRKTDNNVLTFEAYNELGGLKGSIATIAEDILAYLSEEISRELEGIFRELISINPYEEDTVWSKRVSEEVFCNTKEKRKLVDKFIAARLLVVDSDGEGRGIVTTAHNALLTNWPRIQSLIEEDKEFFKQREKLTLFRNKWDMEKKQKDYLIQKGTQLDNAAKMLSLRRKDISEELRVYIELSIEKAKRDRRRKVGAGVFTTIVTIAICIFIFLQLSNQIKSREAAKRQEALKKIDLANSEFKQVDRLGSIKSSLSVLTSDISKDETAILKEGEDLLYNGLFLPMGQDNVKGLITEDNNIVDLAFNSNGDKFIVSSSDGTLSLYSTKSLNKLNQVKTDIWNQISFLKNDNKIIVSSTNKISVFDESTLKQTKTMTIDKLMGFKLFHDRENIICLTNPEGTQIMNIHLVSLDEEKVVTTCKLPFDDENNPFYRAVEMNENYIIASYDEYSKDRTAIVLFDKKTGLPYKCYYMPKTFQDMKLIQENILRVVFNDGTIVDYEFGDDKLIEKNKLIYSDLIKDFKNGESKITISKDFTTLAVLNKSECCVIDINKRKLVMNQGMQGVKDFKLSDDGRYLMLLTNDNNFIMLNVSEGKILRSAFKITDDKINYAVPKFIYNAEEKCLITLLNSKQLQVVMDEETVGKSILEGDSLGESNLEASYLNEYIVKKEYSKLDIIDTNDDKNEKSFDIPEGGTFTTSINNDYGYLNTFKGEIWVIELKTGNVLRKLNGDNILAESNSGNILAVRENNNTIIFYNINEENEYKIDLQQCDSFEKCAFNNKEDRFAISRRNGDDTSVEFWDFKNNKLQKVLQIKYQEDCSYLAFSIDDTKLHFTTWKSAITLFYDIESGKLLDETTEDYKHLFMINEKEGEIRSYWNGKNFKISVDLYNKIKSEGVIKYYIISQSKTKVAVIFDDLSLKVYSLSEGKEIRKLLYVPDTCRISFNEKENGLRILYSDAFGIRKVEFPFLVTKEIIELGKKQIEEEE
ncbi:hypothetical protein [Clostridium sp.]|uniref:nSTAND1 domain-containing NTPase n=1 Tax=Clostridium sp. TaxID=1506 RepID=UPI00262BD8B8|nr:hypothetical protein [Clostridium sp.]